MSSIIVNETKNVAFNIIEVPEEENARTVLKGIPELAEEIRRDGLLQNLVVSNGGKGERTYRLVAGFRRAAALKLLKWGDKTVPVTVVPAQGRAIKNLAENIHRDELCTADLAARLHDLSTGDYPRDKGEERVVYSKDDLAAQLGLSVSHITNLIRAHANLAGSVRKAWQKDELPQNLIFKAAGMNSKEEQVIELKDEKTGKKLKDEEGNVKTKTVKVTVPDEAGQEKLLARWQKAKEVEALAQKGEKKEKPEGGSEPGEGDGDVETSGKKPGKKQLAEFIEKAKENLKAMTAEKLQDTAEFFRLKGKLEGVQWAAGERDALAPRG